MEEMTEFERQGFVLDEVFIIFILAVVGLGGYVAFTTQNFGVFYLLAIGLVCFAAGAFLFRRPILFKSIVRGDGLLNLGGWVIGGTVAVRIGTTFILSRGALNGTGLTDLITVGLMSPVCETLIFNWFIQGLAETWGHPVIGIFAGTGAACIYHFPRYAANPLYLLAVILAFCFFCTSFTVSRRPGITMAFHSVVNLFG
jgi:hypothetical protein